MGTGYIESAVVCGREKDSAFDITGGTVVRDRTNFSVGLIQMDSQDNFQKNLFQASEYAREAVERGADLIMFPETMEYTGRDLTGNACLHNEEIRNFYAQLASKHQVYVHSGSFTEYQVTGKPWNTTLLLNPRGKVIAQYRKLHMFDVNVEDGPSYQESRTIMPGEEIVVARMNLADVGFATCYDLRFPELFRLMVKNGAQVIFLPANFTADTGRAHWETLLRARAIENTCYIVACGQTGQKKAFQAYGHSMVIDPWGEIVDSLGEEAGCLVVSIDLSRVDKVRKQLPSLHNIREDAYSLTSKKLKVYEE